MQPLTPFGDLFDWRLGTDYLGEILDPTTSERFAKGELHPSTLQPILRSDQIEDVNHLHQEEKKIAAGKRIQHLEKNSDPPTLVIDTCRGKEFGTNVWSSICSVKHEPSSTLIQHKALEDDDIKVLNLWEFESVNPLKTKTHPPPSSAQSPVDLPAHVPKYDFQPVPGVEILHRRQKRIPSSDLCGVDTDHMTTELHPWSASKKLKQQSSFPVSIKNEGFWANSHNIISQAPEPTNVHDIHETLRMASRCWNQPKGDQPAHFDDIHIPTGVVQVNNAEVREESPFSSPTFSHLQPSYDRYRKAGIMKFKPYRVPPPSIPFTLPKKEA
jgi:hypothetical protein